jgi:uncharacterized repeat protein (TIGR01451 family)
LVASSVPAAGFSILASGFIDEFAYAQRIRDAASTSDSTPQGIPSILGGQRDVAFEVYQNEDGNDAQVNISPASARAAFSAEAGVVAEAIYQWDGSDQSMTLVPDGIGVDLTEGGAIDAMQAAIVSSDLGGRLTVEAYTSATQYSIVTMSTFAVSPGSPLTAILTFQTFQSPGLSGGNIVSVVCGGGGCVDFTNFGALQVRVNVPPRLMSLDFAYGSIRTVKVNPDILKEVSVDGGDNWFDANGGTGSPVPVQAVGGGALYRITVTNPGSTTLTNVVINDAPLGIVNYAVGSLAPGQTVVLTAGEIAALNQPKRCTSVGIVENLARVTATSPVTGAPVSAEDPANVECVTAAIEIVKEVSVDGGLTYHDANDDGTPAQSPPTTGLGGDALYRIRVTNKGATALKNVTVTDVELGISGLAIGNLAVGQSVLITDGIIDTSGGLSSALLNKPGRCPTDTTGKKTNIATVTGDPVPAGTSVSDSDPAVVVCVRSSIEIVKEVSVDAGATYQDANGGASSPAAVTGLGGDALYRIRVTNTGPTALADVVVNDSDLGISNYPVGDLLPGQTVLITDGVIDDRGDLDEPKLNFPGRCPASTPQDVPNLAQATGQPVPSGNPVADDDPAIVKCVASGIKVLKEVSVDGGASYVDANDVPSAPQTAVGGDALYRITVTNIGATTLANVKVDDTELGIIGFLVGTLVPGESRVIVDGVLDTDGDMELGALFAERRCDMAGPRNNTAIASGDPQPSGVEVSALDPAVVVCVNVPAQIGNEVFEDLNKNGQRDSGEPGVPGATITIAGPGGYTNSATTGADGLYLFPNLVPGAYTLTCQAPMGYSYTTPFDQGSTVDKDSNANPAGGGMGTHTLVSGDSNLTIDCGLVSLAPPEPPRIDIRKQAEGPDSREFAAGATVPFEIQVTNTGSVPLTGVAVSDPLVPACDKAIGDLGVGASQTYSCETTLGTGETKVFKDTFSTKSYSNNDGTHNWAGPWVEDDVAGAGPTSGNVLIGSNYKLWLDDNPDTGTQPSAARTADLTGATSAILSFEWITHDGVDTDDEVVAEVSSNGGASYTVLKRFTGFSGSKSGTESFDIKDYISSQTTIRFRVAKNYGGSSETFKVDNLVLTAQMPAGGGFTNQACASGQGAGQTVSDCDESTVVVKSSGGEGCTPGYWKQVQHFDSWTGYAPATRFSAVFEGAFGTKTLLQVVSLGGGGLDALGRHTVAALLNAANPDVDYGMTAAQVIAKFNAVYPGSSAAYEALKNEFEAANESGCPLN